MTSGSWLSRQVLQTVRQFRVRLSRHRLVDRRRVREELLADTTIRAAMDQHATTTGRPLPAVRRQVERYIEEIVPFFNVLSYYRVGYNIARALIHLLYRPAVTWEARDRLNAIPRRDIVVYLMNHRSNADYVVVAYVLARGVSVSYAVGEWARTWPLEYVFKSFGSYFVRRRFREPLYHAVLERYVQLITRNGVTQGIFLEGGLSRDGTPRPAKIGLLDYLVRTLDDRAFERDIWLVPVAVNYDRVLEDRVLVRELLDHTARTGRLRQGLGVARYLLINLARLVTGQLRRYGRVAVNFGAPVSVREWAARYPGVLTLPRASRLPYVQTLADDVMHQVHAIMPVTPVPLAAAALLSFGASVVSRAALLRRIEDYRDHLAGRDAKLVHADRDPTAIFERAWKTFGMRRFVHHEDDTYVIMPTQRPMLQFYANSIRHLLPAESAQEDPALPRLRPR